VIELRAVPGRTGRLLGELLAEKGVNLTTGDVEAVVSYGRPVNQNLPTLNGAAGTRNKYEELRVLHAAGIPVPAFGRTPEEVAGGGEGTPRVLGRMFKHSKGTDIAVLRDARRFTGSEYFVRYIAPEREYRVWAFRGQCLGVYEKLLRYPRKQARDPQGIPWNWRRGYAFEFYHNAPEDLKALGVASVKALGLDFGAVDILHGQDGLMYVLEVNTAPGVRDRRQGITYLATKIARWATKGFKERK
jgi:hypothetical protein